MGTMIALVHLVSWAALFVAGLPSQDRGDIVLGVFAGGFVLTALVALGGAARRALCSLDESG